MAQTSCRSWIVKMACTWTLAAAAAGTGTARAKPCAECGTEAPEASRFCGACGEKFSLSKSCAECGQASAGEARFCGHCGARFPFASEDEERLVAATAKARKEYLDSLRQVVAFYEQLGLAEKAAVARAELEAAERNDRIRPRTAAGAAPGEAAPPIAFESIEEADRLYAEAETYRRSPNLFRRKEYLRKALELYEKVILKHPTSDKVDDCAYRIGEIYGSPFFASYEKAIRYYEKCVTWNPDTDFDARYRAAELAERRLSDVPLAIHWYRLAAERDPVPENRKAAADRLRRLQPPPDE